MALCLRCPMAVRMHALVPSHTPHALPIGNDVRPMLRCIAAFAKKKENAGFGDGKASGGGGESRRAKQKARRVNIKREQSPIPGQGQASGMGLAPAMLDVEVMEASMAKKEDDDEFAARLAVIKQKTQARSASMSSATPGTSAADANVPVCCPLGQEPHQIPELIIQSNQPQAQHPPPPYLTALSTPTRIRPTSARRC